MTKQLQKTVLCKSAINTPRVFTIAHCNRLCVVSTADKTLPSDKLIFKTKVPKYLWVCIVLFFYKQTFYGPKPAGEHFTRLSAWIPLLRIVLISQPSELCVNTRFRRVRKRLFPFSKADVRWSLRWKHIQFIDTTPKLLTLSLRHHIIYV